MIPTRLSYSGDSYVFAVAAWLDDVLQCSFTDHRELYAAQLAVENFWLELFINSPSLADYSADEAAWITHFNENFSDIRIRVAANWNNLAVKQCALGVMLSYWWEVFSVSPVSDLVLFDCSSYWSDHDLKACLDTSAVFTAHSYSFIPVTAVVAPLWLHHLLTTATLPTDLGRQVHQKLWYDNATPRDHPIVGPALPVPTSGVLTGAFALWTPYEPQSTYASLESAVAASACL